MEYNPKHRRRLRATKAYDNNTFLNSREARHIRVQCEIEEPGMRLQRLGVDNMITFFGSARTKPDTPDYNNAYLLAYKLGQWTKKHAPTTAISTGGGPGIMEASNRGAFESGAKSIGMGISLPFEQHNNEYIDRIKNYLIGWTELGDDTSEIMDYFSKENTGDGQQRPAIPVQQLRAFESQCQDMVNSQHGIMVNSQPPELMSPEQLKQHIKHLETML